MSESHIDIQGHRRRASPLADKGIGMGWRGWSGTSSGRFIYSLLDSSFLFRITVAEEVARCQPYVGIAYSNRIPALEI